MDRRILVVLLLAHLTNKVYSQSNDTTQGPDFEDETSQVNISQEEGSDIHAFGETLDAPLIEDAETTTAYLIDDEIKCANNLCTCSQEKDGDAIKITVDCSSKDLIEIPTGIDSRVTRLLLQDNKIEEVPRTISEFQDLEELNVNDNSIREFAFGSISELPKLRVLKAANNRLLEFPQELKNGIDLRSLEELDLGNNDMREVVTADLFTHMESISSLILPAATHDLIVNLCHHMHETLQKVCINDCDTDIEECVNYTENPSDLIPSQDHKLKDDIGFDNYLNSTFGETTAEGNNSGPKEPEIETKNSLNSNFSKALDQQIVSTLSNNSDSIFAANSDDEDNTHQDIHSDSNTESTTTISAYEENVDTTTVPIVDNTESTTTISAYEENVDTTTVPIVELKTNSSENSIGVDNDKLFDVSLRNALNVAVDANEKNTSTSTKTISTTESEEKENKSENALHSAKSELDKDITADGNEGIVEASSSKQGGGISNSIIAIIVAGMVVVVAGVTIGKNWKTITNKFRPRSSAATGAPASNGITPEEVPLQNKAMV